MFEKYVPDFDEKTFLRDMAKSRGITMADAMKVCRKEIPLESYYQRKIMKEIREKHPDAFIYKVAQAAYSRGGVPDVACIIKGHYFGFEVKRPVVGEATGLQLKTISQIMEAGGTACIVRWPEEALKIIEEWRKQNE